MPGGAKDKPDEGVLRDIVAGWGVAGERESGSVEVGWVVRGGVGG